MLSSVRVLKPVLGNVKNVFERANVEFKLYQYKIRHYSANVTFSFERGDFLVKTAESGEELERCLKLRFNVFHKEYMNKRRQLGIDVDHLDDDCDHLMIVDKRTSQVIGTYRLNSSLFTGSYYSQSEFHLNRVLELPAPRLELGRACIDREFRTGTVIALLWRGIAEYIRQTNTQVLFGCSSIKTLEPMQIAAATKYLRDTGRLDNGLGVSPTKKYRVPQLPFLLEYLDRNENEYKALEIEKIFPALFRSYIKMGAKFCGEPALDRELGCIDFLTVIKTEDFGDNIKGKYKVG